MQTPPSPQPKISLQTQNRILGVVLVVSLLTAMYVLFGGLQTGSGPTASQIAGGPAAFKKWDLSQIPFDGKRAMGYLQTLCDIGPRPSGSIGMQQQRKLLIEHFKGLGGTVTEQEFKAPDPISRAPVAMANILVTWHPERKERILLCTHYDTRPFPDQDPVNRKGIFLGANDGGSGTAILMQMGERISQLKGEVGVDFVLFDGEELVYGEAGEYFLGAKYFAQQYVQHPPGHTYRWGILLDMVGDAHLLLYQETHSARWKDTKPLVDSIWGVAKKLGVGEFVPQTNMRWTVQDDHLPLHDIGKIPTCDIIDFDYPAWHTTQDTPRECSPLSLAKVGWVVQTWLEQATAK
jgi:hypothetical protein